MELIFAAPSPTTEIPLRATRCGACTRVNEFRHSGSISRQRLHYDDSETVLIAPSQFAERFRAEAMKFGSFISHEDIAVHASILEQLLD